MQSGAILADDAFDGMHQSPNVVGLVENVKSNIHLSKRLDGVTKSINQLVQGWLAVVSPAHGRQSYKLSGTFEGWTIS
jgi:hypothetical protein